MDFRCEWRVIYQKKGSLASCLGLVWFWGLRHQTHHCLLQSLFKSYFHWKQQHESLISTTSSQPLWAAKWERCVLMHKRHDRSQMLHAIKQPTVAIALYMIRNGLGGKLPVESSTLIWWHYSPNKLYIALREDKLINFLHLVALSCCLCCSCTVKFCVSTLRVLLFIILRDNLLLVYCILSVCGCSGVCLCISDVLARMTLVSGR